MKEIKMIKTILYYAAAIFFGYAFYTRYWQHRDCINASNSSCYIEGQGNLIEGGSFWIIPFMVFLVLALVESFRVLRRMTKH